MDGDSGRTFARRRRAASHRAGQVETEVSTTFSRPVSILLAAAVVSVAACAPPADEAGTTGVGIDGFAQDRALMVGSTVAARGVTDRAVLSAMRTVPRHLFVPREFVHLAYTDQALPIGHDQTISQPYIVALMAELADLGTGDKVLEVGTGSGYGAAVLSEIADSVYTIEILGPLAEAAAARLDSLGYANVVVRHGDGYRGWPERAPFDAIVVTAAPDHVPEPLLSQLAPGGRLVIPVGDFHQELLCISRTERGDIERAVIPVRFVPMTGEALNRAERAGAE